MKALWSALIYSPLFNILLLLLVIFQGSLWLAIVILTVLIRAALRNTTKHQTEMQKWMGDMQWKLKELEEKYKDQPEKLAQESMKLMKDGGLAPLKWCLWLLIQLPIFIGLNNVIRNFWSGNISADHIYSFFVPFTQQYIHLENIQHVFLGIDLFKNHNVWLTLVGAVLIFLQTKLTMMLQSKNAQATPATLPWWQQMPDMQKMMMPMNIFMVFMMWAFIWNTTSGLGLYIVVSTLISVIQYTVQNREFLKIKWMTRWVDTAKLVNKRG